MVLKLYARIRLLDSWMLGDLFQTAKKNMTFMEVNNFKAKLKTAFTIVSYNVSAGQINLLQMLLKFAINVNL